jgi:hypothetical protein
MKQLRCTFVIIIFAASAQAADVGVSISVGQPGFMAALTSETHLNLKSFTQTPSWFDGRLPVLFISQSACT